MTILEGYDLVMNKIDELKKNGIKSKVNIIEKDDELEVDDYELPEDKWRYVCLFVKNNEDLSKIREVGLELNRMGILFDDMFGGETVDWMIDWSFEVK